MPCHISNLSAPNLFAHLEACVTLFDGTSTLEDALLSHWGFYLTSVDFFGLPLTCQGG
jgi:hypothetical protein